ncbi:MAG TPA: response regulator transcription factor [Actinomycetota bacterium]|nr:response regulator transcription factor [Actinomycetota bacterium]
MPIVLVVDDEADIRFVVRRMIEGMESETPVVHEASTGDEAIEVWRVLQPDVIVLDQRMPGLSGLETAAKILAEQPAQRIILFTAYRDDLEEMAVPLNGHLVARLSKAQLNRLPTELQALFNGAGRG